MLIVFIAGTSLGLSPNMGNVVLGVSGPGVMSIANTINKLAYHKKTDTVRK